MIYMLGSRVEGLDTMHYNVCIITSGKKPPTKNTKVFNNGNFVSQERNK